MSDPNIIRCAFLFLFTLAVLVGIGGAQESYKKQGES